MTLGSQEVIESAAKMSRVTDNFTVSPLENQMYVDLKVLDWQPYTLVWDPL